MQIIKQDESASLFDLGGKCLCTFWHLDQNRAAILPWPFVCTLTRFVPNVFEAALRNTVEWNNHTTTSFCWKKWICGLALYNHSSYFWLRKTLMSTELDALARKITLYHQGRVNPFHGGKPNWIYIWTARQWIITKGQ